MSTIDGAATFLGMKPRKDLTTDFRSATMKRSAQLPQGLPSSVKAELKAQKEYAHLSKELELFEARIGSGAEKEMADQT